MDENSDKNLNHAKSRSALTAAVIFMAVTILGIYFLFLSMVNTAKKNQINKEVKNFGANKTANVLFISSYSESFITVPDQIAGLREGFKDINVNLDIEFMDSRNYPEDENIQQFTSTLSYKMKVAAPYDVVLLGDDKALSFGLEHKDDLFKNIPIVFFGINDLETAKRAAKDPQFTGSSEYNFTVETFEIAKSLLPNARKCVYFVESSVTGQADEGQMQLVKDKYPDYEFERIDAMKLTRDQFISQVKKIDKDSIVIYISAFHDMDGNEYSIDEMTEIISSNFNGPVFRNTIGGFNHGLLGGVMADYTAMGREAAKTASDIINGRSVSVIPLSDENQYQVVFDYQLMRKYKLPMTVLPEDTKFVNKEATLLEEHQTVFVVTGIVVAILAILLSITLMCYLKSKDNANELKKMKDELEQTLERDLLTSLPNRRMIARFLKTIQPSSYAAVIFDLDDFKNINDNYSHEYGDIVIKKLAERLSKFASEHDAVLARYGGDEFLLLMEKVRLHIDGPILSELIDVLNAPVNCNGYAIPVNCSVGIKNPGDDVKTGEDMIQSAEIAMFEAKKHGKHTYMFFKESMKEQISADSEIRQLLAGSMHSNGFYMLYQPQISLQNMEVSGYEALLRMRNGKYGPGEFIPVAEKYGLISEIGRIITRMVMKDFADCREKGLPVKRVAINYSCGQINDRGYIKYLKDTMDEFHVPGSCIEIEITESLFLNNNEEAMNLFDELRRLGIKIAMDDFGTGFSSLSYLTYIPVNYLKLDKTMVDHYLVPGKETFVEDLINMAHHLDKEVIVEGVEEKSQLEQLKKFGADYIQGYYFSKPIEAEDACRFQI